MLSLQEHREISEAVQSMDDAFTDAIVDQAEYFEIEEDPVTLQTTVTLFDANGAAISTANVEDYDVALTYLEDVFELDWNDPDEADDDAAAGASRWGHAD